MIEPLEPVPIMPVPPAPAPVQKHPLQGSGWKPSKVIDKIQLAAKEKRFFYSLEFMPPKTAAGLKRLYPRIERLAGQGPMFMNVIYKANGETAQRTLEIASVMQDKCRTNAMIHLTCTNISQKKIKEVFTNLIGRPGTYVVM
jgi:hypothetical protein